MLLTNSNKAKTYKVLVCDLLRKRIQFFRIIGKKNKARQTKIISLGIIKESLLKLGVKERVIANTPNISIFA